MDFVAVVDQVITLLRHRGRVAYRTLKVQFHLDAEYPEVSPEWFAHYRARFAQMHQQETLS